MGILVIINPNHHTEYRVSMVSENDFEACCLVLREFKSKYPKTFIYNIGCGGRILPEEEANVMEFLVDFPVKLNDVMQGVIALKKEEVKNQRKNAILKQIEELQEELRLLSIE